jgi:hypothetical protein
MQLNNIHGDINIPFVKLGLRLIYDVINNYCEKVFENYELPGQIKKIFCS